MGKKKVPDTAYRQNDPSPGGAHHRRGRRVFVFLVVVVFAAVELATGADLQTVLLTVLGVGLAGAVVARWVCDDAPLPSIARILGQADNSAEGPR
jgi:hypothetical protein